VVGRTVGTETEEVTRGMEKPIFAGMQVFSLSRT
jgi:hypothetical protein